MTLIDKLVVENDLYKVVRREYGKNDIVWFVVKKNKGGALVLTKKKDAMYVYNKLTEM